jgi:hypothetical protein
MLDCQELDLLQLLEFLQMILMQELMVLMVYTPEMLYIARYFNLIYRSINLFIFFLFFWMLCLNSKPLHFFFYIYLYFKGLHIYLYMYIMITTIKNKALCLDFSHSLFFFSVFIIESIVSPFLHLLLSSFIRFAVRYRRKAVENSSLFQINYHPFLLILFLFTL